MALGSYVGVEGRRLCTRDMGGHYEDSPALRSLLRAGAPDLKVPAPRTLRVNHEPALRLRPDSRAASSESLTFKGFISMSARRVNPPGELVLRSGPDGAAPRRHTYGLLGDKTHTVGTCRAKAAAGAPCSRVDGCVSGRCSHALAGGPGLCEQPHRGGDPRRSRRAVSLAGLLLEGVHR